jgi:hypothetical protein
LVGQQRHLAYSNGHNNRSVGKATATTTLHTATALVVNSPVKVKARTSNVYVQNVTRCHINTIKFVKFVLKIVKVDNCNLIYCELHFKIYYFC